MPLVPPTLTTDTFSGAPLLGPEQIADLLVLPVFRTSVAGQVFSRLDTSAHTVRIPIITADPSAAWIPEGTEIPVSEGELDELIVTPAKLGGLAVVSSEMIQDSYAGNGDAATLIGQGLARDIARKVDEAAFGPAMAAPAPGGLSSLPLISTVPAPGTWANLDPFVMAAGLVEAVYGSVTAWVCNPAELVLLQLIKQGTTSAQDIAIQDATSATGRAVLGRPIYASPAVPDGVIYGVDGSQAFLCIRDDASVDSSPYPLYTSDRWVVRGLMRLGFGFPHQQAAVKITRASS